MIKTLVTQIAERIGTATGSALAAYGVSHDDITILIAAIPVLLGLLVDLATRTIINKGTNT